tara:strand:+ start:125 stop:382 length:258 start_codon:yes stop_codon:yes gene_type:complete
LDEMNKPECVIGSLGNKYWLVNIDPPDLHSLIYHREDGPAIEYADGTNEWWLDGNLVNPEAMVDLWLMRGKFCFYDEDNDCLSFG